MTWTVSRLLVWASDYLKQKGVLSPRLDAELLLADALNWDRIKLYTSLELPLNQEELGAFKARLTRRAAFEPVAYILGRKEFWGLEFEVGPGVLIPRPETETLVEEAIRLLGASSATRRPRKVLPWTLELSSVPSASEDLETEGTALEGEATPVPVAEESASGPLQPRLALDLCTGSGIIPVCLARDTDACVIGVDVSSDALEYARRNVEKHVPPKRVALLEGDLAAPVPRRFHRQFDIVTANPPYLLESESAMLSPDIRKYEPALALFSGADGLDICRRLLKAAPVMLKPGGNLLVEIGTPQQAQALERLMAQAGLQAVRTVLDLGRRPRVVCGTLG